MNFDSFEVNLLPSLVKAYEKDFHKGKNIIGASSLPYGMRKVVIKKCYNIKTQPTMKMIAGHIIEEIFQKEPMLSYMIKKINSQLSDYSFKYVNDTNFYKLKNGNYGLQKVTPELGKMIEILDFFLRTHPDIYTSLYAIEIKYTGLNYKEFIKEEYLDRIIHYQIQLNTYLGIYGLKFGFLLIILAGIWSTSSKNLNFVWNNYCKLIPFEFNQELFNQTIERAKEIYSYIKTEDFISPSCPEFLWECDKKYCPVRDDCPIKIEKKKFDIYQTCEYCKEKIRPGLPCLVRNEKIWHYKDKEHKEGGLEMKDCISDCIKSFGGKKDG